MSDADWPVHLTEHLASHSGTSESAAAFTESKTVRTKTGRVCSAVVKQVELCTQCPDTLPSTGGKQRNEWPSCQGRCSSYVHSRS